MSQILTLCTTIRREVLRKTLIRGMIIGSLGIFLLIFSTIYLNVSLMKTWGLFIFLISFFLIVIGLLPYKRLSVHTQNPDKIKIIECDVLEFYLKGNKILAIPVENIKELLFLEKNQIYGIGIFLKSKISLTSHLWTFQFQKAQNKFHTLLKTDLFLPYFSKRSFEELQEWLRIEDNDN